MSNNRVDELIAGPKLPDGSRPFIRRTDDGISCGMMRDAKDGQPVNGCELVNLQRIEGERFRVESIYGHKTGPTKVTSDMYRTGWDKVFGNKCDN